MELIAQLNSFVFLINMKDIAVQSAKYDGDQPTYTEESCIDGSNIKESWR